MSRVVPIQSNINTDQTFFAPNPAVSVEAQAINPNLVVSTLFAADYISTPQAFVSSVNGTTFPPPIDANIVVSTLLVGNYISTPELYISSINSQAYPPPVPQDITVSTIVANDSATAANIFTSTINGVSYPPVIQAQNVIVSTLYAGSTLAATQIITSLITGISSLDALSISNVNNIQCSSINGVQANLLVPPTNVNIGNVVIGVGGSSVVILTNQFSPINFGAFVGYIVPSPTANIVPVADFDDTGSSISSLTINASPGDTVSYIAIGQIIS